MADWYDKKPSGTFLGNLGSSSDSKAFADLLRGIKPSQPTPYADLVNALARTPVPPPSNALTRALSPSLGIFGSLAPSPLAKPFLSPVPSPLSQVPYAVPVQTQATPAPVKRKGFFSFHFDDLMRVNNVRNAWKIAHPDRAFMRNFYDRSIWESRKLESDDALKRLIRSGMEHASAVCVLIGTHTWSRPWVKYEIARSVVDRRGLLAVHINSLKHHQRLQPDQRGFNPLRLMGIYKAPNGKFYLYERRPVVNGFTGQTEWQWHPYDKYALAVSLPRYLQAPDVGFVMPLSTGTEEYDYVAGEGHKNLGTWIDRAAQRVGR